MTTFDSDIYVRIGVGSHITIQVSGSLDLANSDLLIATASRYLEAGCSLAVDLANVTFIDSTGVRSLLAIRAACVNRGSDLTLSARSPAVANVMDILGVTNVFLAAGAPELDHAYVDHPDGYTVDGLST